MSKKARKVGILTAGGDAPGLNAVIRGLGKTIITHYGMELIGFRDGITGLVENRYVNLDGSTLSGILTLGGTILGTSRDKVNKFPLHGEQVNMVPTVKENLDKLGIDALVMLGGGGTAKNAKLLMDAGVNVILLPKTIDNDIWGTDTSFGFATAMEVATQAVDRLHSTAHSHHRIILAEIMGHRAGWLALGAGIAGGADIILIPEIPYTIDSVTETIRARISRGSTFSVVAVAEGARDATDTASTQAALELVSTASTPENKKAAKIHLATVQDAQREHTFKLARELESTTGLETRVSILGYIQRGGTPSAEDRLLATRLGSATADHIYRGEYGILVAARGQGTEPVALEDVAGKLKSVPTDHHWIQTARWIGTGLGD
ncbi:MAG: ATP-dependent 6-phosphofructokinase [Propionibacteriaceae bacterium]|nr:ATP-dependent 6-phosphofructokinase [Propionibacteriaceae bacterium]